MLTRFKNTSLKWVLGNRLCWWQSSAFRNFYLNFICNIPTPQKKSICTRANSSQNTLHNGNQCERYLEKIICFSASWTVSSSWYPVQLPGLGTTTHSANCLNYSHCFNVFQDPSKSWNQSLQLKTRQTTIN